MGTRYNAAHIPEEDVRQAWANYSKYSYYYDSEMKKAEESLKNTLSSARSRLIAKGITEDNPQFQREMDRITNIARADISSLQEGKRSLETGAIRDLLLSGQITKYSAGNYGAYTGGIFEARRRLGQERIQEGEEEPYKDIMPGRIVGQRRDPFSEEEAPSALSPWERQEPDIGGRGVDPNSTTYYVRRDEAGNVVEQLDEATYSKYTERAGQRLMTMPEYYTSVWGAYDPHFDVRKEKEVEAEKVARGKAGSRSYTVQMQPRGRPGGGKPGNPFMQTGREIAQERAPEEERRKAWWM